MNLPPPQGQSWHFYLNKRFSTHLTTKIGSMPITFHSTFARLLHTNARLKLSWSSLWRARLVFRREHFGGFSRASNGRISSTKQRAPPTVQFPPPADNCYTVWGSATTPPTLAHSRLFVLFSVLTIFNSFLIFTNPTNTHILILTKTNPTNKLGTQSLY